jgi:hypothetical protein
MVEAPCGSIFIWANGDLDYPRKLAAFLNRDDLRIVSAEMTRETRRFFGLTFPAVVVDHFCQEKLTPRGRELIYALTQMTRP